MLDRFIFGFKLIKRLDTSRKQIKQGGWMAVKYLTYQNYDIIFYSWHKELVTWPIQCSHTTRCGYMHSSLKPLYLHVTCLLLTTKLHKVTDVFYAFYLWKWVRQIFYCSDYTDYVMLSDCVPFYDGKKLFHLNRSLFPSSVLKTMYAKKLKYPIIFVLEKLDD